MSKPNLTVRYQRGNGCVIAWEAYTARGESNVACFIEDLLDDLDTESKSREVEEASA
jgi:hypothetical protein